MAPPFTVATIAREPLPVMARFLTWYLDQGAARIIVYLDDPADPAQDAFTHPRISFVPCTPDFWATLGLSPDKRFTRRQNAAITAAYHALGDGWLLAVDADELMHVAGKTLAQAVQGFPADAVAISVATAEQVFLSDGSQAFRLPIPRATVNAIYGEDAPLFRPRFGLVGHADGKSFHRAGRPDIRLRQHWAHDAADNRIVDRRLDHGDGAHLLHFATPNYAHWRAKMEWRAGASGFAEAVKVALQDRAKCADPEAAYRALYDTLHVLTPETEAQLDAVGGLMRRLEV